MKKIFVVVLLALLAAGNAFAADSKKIGSVESGSAKNELEQAFDIKYQNIFNEQNNGKTEKRNENQLPVQAKRTFAKMFEVYKIKQTVRSTGTEEEVYYISAENEKESIIVKIDDTLDISIFKKSKEQ